MKWVTVPENCLTIAVQRGRCKHVLLPVLQNQCARPHQSRYLSKNVKQSYHQCMNIECSATFRTLESVEGIIRSPVTEPVIPVPAPAATVNRAGA